MNDRKLLELALARCLDSWISRGTATF